MNVTQKGQYALRALFELAKRGSDAPVKGAEIAEAQAIPPRFLEVILNQLKQSGYVTSRRGAAGGYLLARPPDEVTVGDVLRTIQGPLDPVPCLEDERTACALYGRCVFLALWQQVGAAVAGVLDGTTLADLVESERRLAGGYVPCYVI